MRLLYLLDNSVIQRVHRSPEVAAAVRNLLNSGDLASCLPQALEEGYSARSLKEWDRLHSASFAAKVFLPPNEAVVTIAFEMQEALFAQGMGRAVGVSDLQIAATAMAYSNAAQQVYVVHYDADFDYVNAAYPEFRSLWIVPRGSVA